MGKLKDMDTIGKNIYLLIAFINYWYRHQYTRKDHYHYLNCRRRMIHIS